MHYKLSKLRTKIIEKVAMRNSTFGNKKHWILAVVTVSAVCMFIGVCLFYLDVFNTEQDVTLLNGLHTVGKHRTGYWIGNHWTGHHGTHGGA